MQSFFKLFLSFLPLVCLLPGGIAFAQDRVQSDTTAVSATDTSLVSIEADTSLQGIRFYISRPAGPASNWWDIPPSPLYSVRLNQERVSVSWDSTDTFTVQRSINGVPAALPSILTTEQYIEAKRRENERKIAYRLIQEGKREDEEQRGLLDFKIDVPGGEKSAFTTIFGKPEVNLRVNGSANMNVGASIQNVADESLPPDARRRVDPTFNQNLQLNIQGTIGDKLTIATDWDTERQFDFQNRLSIVYEGYEDEIIKRVELGNVSMETGNSLIQGGASLFGIKSIAELGPLKLTTVVSQQKGESKSQTIRGGSQETEISIRPSEYQNNRHFFIDYYNRQQFEENLSNPQVQGQAYQIQDLRIWISEPQIGATDDDAFKAAAFTDFGVVRNPDGSYALPDPDADIISEDSLEANRLNQNASAANFGVSGSDFYNGYFRPLQEGADYTINPGLGTLTLRRGLSPGSVLAVSFVRAGQNGPVEVGDLNPRSTGLTYLKMIRPNNLVSNNKAWSLTMRNIYSLNLSSISQESLELNINFTQGNIQQTNLPGTNTTLLRELGLDRTNTQGAVEPDNLLDFNGMVVDAQNGTIMFPYLEPFGQRIAEIQSRSGSVDSALVFNELYDESQYNAEQSEKNGFYQIDGVSKGGASSTFNLGYSIVEGSVSVFANGTQLVEGVDYEVDYSYGILTILSQQYLAQGQDIRIESENNQLVTIGQKNFTGLRAEYKVNEEISLGSTYFKLKEQPQTDKIRIGNEPINNTVIGVDAKADFDTPWVTRLIDKVPLLQTKEASNFSISGEFAQLRPGVAQTNAIRDAIDNNELFTDEEQGLVFIDDFEGVELNLTFKSATKWQLAAPPAAIPGYAPDQNYYDNSSTAQPPSTIEDKRARADLRAAYSWYEIPRSIGSILPDARPTPETETVLINEVFPGRETNNPQDEVIIPMDVHYNPTERGPYNYNMGLKQALEQEPEKMWGGMVATLPPGQEDLNQNNIEFLEFWVQPILPDGREPDAQDLEDYDGKIYIDIGTVSEDIVPNFRLNTEDGLANNLDQLEKDSFDGNARSYVPLNLPAPDNEFSNQNRELEDVGLDGIPSSNGFDSEKVETTLFAEFLQSMEEAYGESSQEYQNILRDPSNDDYVFYSDDRVQGLPLQERFYRLLGYHEGNSPAATSSGTSAITKRPDTEGLENNSNVEQNNAYYQYEIDLNPADFDKLNIGSEGTYIVDKVPASKQSDRWHLVRIPLTEFKRKVGDIQGFQNISYIRMWMSGYKKPFTLRFATFEFVGSQWRKVADLNESKGSVADFKISTINIEENANRSPIPYRQPEGSIRALNRGVQVQSLANEQSISLNVEGLGSQEIKMVKRVYPDELNLLNYSNMRMFVHGEGYDSRGEAELVVRMGTDLNSNYYEYRQPITPSDPDFNYSTYDPEGGGDLEGDAEEVWLYEENSMNIVLAAFNELKQLRDQQGNNDPSQVFELALDQNGQTAPGAVVAVKGNPSLDRVSEIGMGVRNPHDPNMTGNEGTASLNGEFWLNELRVSGFDNEKGWKANAKASFKMADFATVNTNFTRETTGFGGLDSRLGQRSVSDVTGYDLSSTVNLHKLIPDRFGWRFPVTVTKRRNESTPKFLPNQGDIRLDEFIGATRSNEELSENERQQIIDEKIREVQTVRESFSVNMSNISKSNSKSKLAQYTLDNTSLSYVYNEGYSRNPELQFQNNWNYNAGIEYNLTFRNVKLFRPFNFTKNIPVIRALAGLQLGYMPSSVSAASTLRRNYDEKRRKTQINQSGEILPQPLQQTHQFEHTSRFGFNYNLTPSIATSFRTNTSFDLSQAGIRDLNQAGIDSSQYRVLPTFDVIEGIISDTLSARRSQYNETYSATWRPRLNRIKPLEWLRLSTSYTGGYAWTNSARGSNLGATVSNRFSLDNSITLDTENIFDRIPLVSSFKEKNEEAAKAAKNDTTGFNLGKKLEGVGRNLLLAFFGMENIDLNYKKEKTSSQVGYTGQSQIFYAFGGSGENTSPPMAYRLGFDEELPIDQFISSTGGSTNLLLPQKKNYSDNVTLGTKLNFFENFSVDLDWSTRWTEQRTNQITLNNDGSRINSFTSSGDVSSSVWAFGKSYAEFFEKQVETARADYNGEGEINDETGNNDGRTVLNLRTLEEDFRNNYLYNASSAFGKRGFTPVPKPGWSVVWSGFEKIIPFLGRFMSRATLSHSYTGEYRVGWNYNVQQGTLNEQSIARFTIVDRYNRYEPKSINVQQTFSPLLQLNITWLSDLRTQIGFTKSRLASLSPSSKTLSETDTQGLKVSLNYSFKRVTIPFFPKIKNNVDITINGNIAEDTKKTYNLGSDLSRLFDSSENGIPEAGSVDLNPTDINGQKRINASLVVGYRFSSTISSNFEYTYLKLLPKTSSRPLTTNHDIRFNVKIAIRSR